MKCFINSIPGRVVTWGVVFLASLTALAHQIPVHTAHEMDVDEGINLMKAHLVTRDFGLFDTIWSDQPPLFTVLLSGWFQIAGESVASGRVLVMISSACLLASLFSILSLTRRLFAGSIAVAFLFLSSIFVKYSGAVMIGIPAISFAVFAMLLLQWAGTSRSLFYASGFFFACAIMTKLFVLAIAPSFLTLFLFNEWQSERFPLAARQALIRFAHWTLVIAGFVIALAMLFGPALLHGEISQLIHSHASEKARSELGGIARLWKLLRADRDLLPLAAIGILLGLYGRRYDFLVPLVWFGSALSALSLHRPLWPHHYPLVSLPLVWLSAIAVDEVVRRPLPKSWNFVTSVRALSLAFFVYSISLVPSKWVRIRERVYDFNNRVSENSLAHLAKHANQTRWVVSDRPIYPFMLHLSVPPEIAVPSAKRKHSGELSASLYLAVIERYQPEQIIMKRFRDIARAIHDTVQDRYHTVQYDGRTLIMLRKDLFYLP